MSNNQYTDLMNRKNSIMQKSIGINYSSFEKTKIAFDYEKMMQEAGYSLQEIQDIQNETSVGNTPLYELRNISHLARKFAPQGKGARIFLKDEACNPSGSFKARRAAAAVYHAKKNGYKGVIAATSGNYGAAVASQAAMRGLNCIIVQECYDSRGVGQPEILEKARKCEAFGAEVMQLSVGPELFYTFLKLLDETGYFNASLYTPFGIAGVETLGYELAGQIKNTTNYFPDTVICTNAGGGNLTGTSRGLKKAGAEQTEVIGASVDLTGLHMASDNDFNKKYFTTGHTGFGIPFSTFPDRSDVPRSAARPMRYMDRYVTVKQGEVFYMTQALALLEGIERGPAGNTSIAAAFSIAQEMDEDKSLVVQETEYTGAGKHFNAQLSFAQDNGIDIFYGNPMNEKPGENIIFPEEPSLIATQNLNLDKIKTSLIKNHISKLDIEEKKNLSDEDIDFLIKETKEDENFVKKKIDELINQ